MYSISPLKPASSQSRKCASSPARSIVATPRRAKPKSAPQRLMSATSVVAAGIDSMTTRSDMPLIVRSRLCLEYGVSQSSLEFVLPDALATEALGAALARAYARGVGADAGDAGAGSAVIYLHGELGAGKTTCVRSLLRALGVAGLIRSPTYTLVEAYEPRGISCVHVDLYRLGGPDAVQE